MKIQFTINTTQDLENMNDIYDLLGCNVMIKGFIGEVQSVATPQASNDFSEYEIVFHSGQTFKFKS